MAKANSDPVARKLLESLNAQLKVWKTAAQLKSELQAEKEKERLGLP